jgi:hypothetical protein
VDRFSSDKDVSSIISKNGTINDNIVCWERIHVKKDSPVSIDIDILHELRNCLVRPLCSITPKTNEILFYCYSSCRSYNRRRRERASTYAVDCIYLSILKLSFIFATLADSKHSTSFSIVVTVLTIKAVRGIRRNSVGYN